MSIWLIFRKLRYSSNSLSECSNRFFFNDLKLIYTRAPCDFLYGMGKFDSYARVNLTYTRNWLTCGKLSYPPRSLGAGKCRCPILLKRKIMDVQSMFNQNPPESISLFIDISINMKCASSDMIRWERNVSSFVRLRNAYAKSFLSW